MSKGCTIGSVLENLLNNVSSPILTLVWVVVVGLGGNTPWMRCQSQGSLETPSHLGAIWHSQEEPEGEGAKRYTDSDFESSQGPWS